MKVKLKQGMNPSDKYWWLNPENEYDAEQIADAEDMIRVDWPDGMPHDLPRDWFDEVSDSRAQR